MKWSETLSVRKLNINTRVWPKTYREQSNKQTENNRPKRTKKNSAKQFGHCHTHSLDIAATHIAVAPRWTQNLNCYAFQSNRNTNNDDDRRAEHERKKEQPTEAKIINARINFFFLLLFSTHFFRYFKSNGLSSSSIQIELGNGVARDAMA